MTKLRREKSYYKIFEPVKHLIEEYANDHFSTFGYYPATVRLYPPVGEGLPRELDYTEYQYIICLLYTSDAADDW